MYAVVGNKSDDYENEKVSDEEGMDLAKKINAVFQRTSAKHASGIDELFKKIGKHFLNPNLAITSNLSKKELKEKNHRIQIEEIKNENKKNKKACC